MQTVETQKPASCVCSVRQLSVQGHPLDMMLVRPYQVASCYLQTS